jgi:hypothetical protein
VSCAMVSASIQDNPMGWYLECTEQQMLGSRCWALQTLRLNWQGGCSREAGQIRIP